MLKCYLKILRNDVVYSFLLYSYLNRIIKIPPNTCRIFSPRQRDFVKYYGNSLCFHEVLLTDKNRNSCQNNISEEKFLEYLFLQCFTRRMACKSWHCAYDQLFGLSSYDISAVFQVCFCPYSILICLSISDH